MPTKSPLCVDLDGTITLIDTLLIGAVLFVRKNPLRLFKLAYWLRRSKPYMKERLFQCVLPDPNDIPYNSEFLAWLQNEKDQGRTIVLATAANHRLAEHVAEHLGLFDQVLASPADSNLKGKYKAEALNALFGRKGYDYAGNSKDDIPVWENAAQAIVVNPDRTVQGQKISNEIKRFLPSKKNYCKLFTIKAYLSK